MVKKNIVQRASRFLSLYKYNIIIKIYVIPLTFELQKFDVQT